jgi:DNA-3-methyladenine glycosylase
VGGPLTGPGPALGEPEATEPGTALLPREFFADRALQVAPRLLGCVLEHQTAEGLVAVELTEVEAYEGSVDPASHSYRGRTARNAVMFGPPGHAYVYFTYGMHFCANLTCGPEGTATAVLLRAGRIIEGAPLAATRRLAGRPAARVPDRDLARGPGRLGQALGIDRAQNGVDACDPASPLRVRAAAQPTAPAQISQGPRVGVSSAADWPWRFWRTGDPTVSLYRRWEPRTRTKPVSPQAPDDGTIHR